MRIDYYGQMKDSKVNTRCACITWRNEKEERIASRIIDLMEKVTAWKHPSGFEDFWLIPMDDRQDYVEFVEFYKEAKKLFIGCEKFGF